MYRSIVSMFHRGEGRWGGGSSEIDINAAEEEREREKEMGTALAHLEKIVADINTVKLADPDKNATKELVKQQKIALGLIGEVKKIAISYFELVEKILHFRSKDSETIGQDNFRDEQGRLDEMRRKKHDTLIDAVNIANRYITTHFGKMSENDMDNFFEKEEAAGRKPIEVDRIDLPNNGICLDTVNLSDRTSVSRWALELAKKIKEKENSVN
jgi:hypothetical protein